MGYYINPKDGSEKEQWLDKHGRMISSQIVRDEDYEVDEWPVCLVWNSGFTAAGIAYDKMEREGFLRECGRPKLWFAVKKDLLKEFM